ncbi:MAG TPA: transporter substrate-binding domain-containing protein [Rectinemataceae bacterium]|nr:transporter substrate-binding domain-containing protein [Rectinemataceae bacterium]
MRSINQASPAKKTLLALACATIIAAPLAAAGPAWKPSPDSVSLAALGLSPAELAWVEARRSSTGTIKAAIRERPDTYEPQPDGSARGFDWLLLREFAGTLGLDIDLTIEQTIDSFFTRNGTVPRDISATGSNYSYTPDLLKKVDLYVSQFGLIPWRQKLMTMIPLVPTRDQLAGRLGEEIRSFSDLDGKRFAVIKDSIQEHSLADMAKARGIRLDFVYGEDETALYRLVVGKEADYLLDASVIFAKNARFLKGMSLSPYPEDVVMTAWCVKKDDRALASILTKFVAAAQRSGLFGRLWTEDYGMDFSTYVNAVLASPETPLK